MDDLQEAKPLGEYVGLQRGNTYKSTLLGQDGPVLLGLASIARNGGFRSDNLKTYGGPSDERMLLEPGDIYVSLKDVTQAADLLGAVARVPNTISQGRLTQDTVKLNFKDEDTSKTYIYWILRTPQCRTYCRAHATGTTNLGLPRDDFLAFSIPPLTPSRCILLDLLQGLDDKIELNRRINETLEAMARALFKDWFVDFGPTRAKAEGRDPYLAPELWDLFPDALDEEGKPVGWVQGILADVAESPRRGVNPSDISEDTPYIGLEHMPRRSIALSEWEGAGKVKSNKTQFHRGEILFGKLRPYFHKVGIAPLDGICSTDIVVAIPRAPDWGAFILACLSSDEFVDYTNRTSTGTKMPRTSWKTMAQYKVFLPPQQVAYAFQDVTQSLLDRLGANIHETAALGETRDCLIPKLMSGEIRLRNVEKAMEAVVEEGNEGAII